MGRAPTFSGGGQFIPPSSTLAPLDSVRRGVAVLSVAVEERRIRRLWDHPHEHGRAWEEPVFVTYFDGGRVRFESPTGLRIQGRRSRMSATKSYRLYFRDLYGASAFPNGVVSEKGQAAVRQLVLEKNIYADAHGHSWRFINALAYDISRRLGATAPQTQPALFVLNGKPQGVYLLKERIHDGFLERRFGHADFLVRRAGSYGDDELQRTWHEVRRFVRRAKTPLTLRRAKRQFDIESLSRWFAAVVFCGTGDAFQPTVVRDRTSAQARWQWLVWDMDLSFRAKEEMPQHGWQKDVFSRVVRGPGRYRDVGHTLLWRLINEDRAYRRYLARLLNEALDRRLTPEFLGERVDHYEAFYDAYGIEDREALEEMREFVLHRPRIVRQQIRQYLAD